MVRYTLNLSESRSVKYKEDGLLLASVKGHANEGTLAARRFWSHPGTACRIPFNGADWVPDMSQLLGFRSLLA